MNRNRKPKPEIDVPAIEVKEDGLVRQRRRYRLITPLFGGGVETQEADPITTVRATEVRGQLRFWWRATRGGQPKFRGNLTRMKAEEERIWGSAAADGKPGPSHVRLFLDNVVDTEKVKKVTVSTKQGPRSVDVGDPLSPYSYVAFPLRADQTRPAGGFRREGVQFTLNVSYPQELAIEIAPALWAWETFGGIGGRTRRGFGALQCEWVKNGVQNRPYPGEELDRWIERNLTDQNIVSRGPWPPNLPHLSSNTHIKILTRNGQAGIEEFWLDLISAYQQFRQSRYRRFGLSEWPEANALRRRVGESPKLPEDVSSTDLVEKFPRAQLGLPIVFGMPHDPALPDTITLQGARDENTNKLYDRLASPLILRPLAFGSQKAGLAAVLEGIQLPPEGLELKEMPGSSQVEAELSKSEASRIRPLKGESNVLLAFLNSL